MYAFSTQGKERECIIYNRRMLRVPRRLCAPTGEAYGVRGEGVEKAGSGGLLRESCVCCCREGTAKFEAICGCPYL